MPRDFGEQNLRPDALPPFDAPRYSHLTRFFGRLEWEEGSCFSWICLWIVQKKSEWKVQTTHSQNGKT